MRSLHTSINLRAHMANLLLHLLSHLPYHSSTSTLHLHQILHFREQPFSNSPNSAALHLLLIILHGFPSSPTPRTSINYHLVQKVVQSAFEQVCIQHIPRSENVKADILSKLASTKLKNRHRSLLQQTLPAPSITSTCHNLTQDQADNWTTPYIQYLKTGNLPPNADRVWITKVARYTMIGDDLYKRGYDQPLLKCVTIEQAQYIIKNYKRAYATIIPAHTP